MGLFYKSHHAANRALCRMYDKGAVDFDTWLNQPIKKTVKGFVIVLGSDSNDDAW